MKIFKFTVGTGERYAKGDTVEEAFLSMGYEGIPIDVKKRKVRSKDVVENKGSVECGGMNYSYEEVKVDKLSKREYIIHGYAKNGHIDQTHEHPVAALNAFLCLCLTRDEMQGVDFFSRQWLIVDGQEEAIEVFWKTEKTNI